MMSFSEIWNELGRLEELIRLALKNSGSIPESIAGTGFWRSVAGVLQPTASRGLQGQVAGVNAGGSDIEWQAVWKTWVPVAGFFTPGPDQTALLVDTGGPQSIITTPASPYDGQMLILYDYEGLAATNPIVILANTANDPSVTIDDPSFPGQTPGASGHMAQQGMTAIFKYFAGAHQWQLVTVSSPYVPTPNSWAQTVWFIDPANSSGVASNSNRGITSGAPLLTFAELIRRWSRTTITPPAPITVTFLSAQPDTTDPVNIKTIGAQYLVLQGQFGAGQQVFSGAISGLVAKNKATGQRLQVTAWGGAAVGQVVVNATHPSVAVVHSVGGGNVVISQPLTAVMPPATVGTPVDTWANTDAIAVYTPSAVRLASLENQAFGIYVRRLSQLAPSGEGTFAGAGVFFIESTGSSALTIGGQEYEDTIINNCRFRFIFCNWPSFQGGGNFTSHLTIVGGSCGDLQAASAAVTNGLLLAVTTHPHTLNGGRVLEIEVDAGAIFEILGLAETQPGSTIWGLGRLDVSGNGNLVLGDTAVSTLLISTIAMDDLQTAFAVSTTAGVLSWLGNGTTGRALTAANLDALVGAGGFNIGSGIYAINPGGGVIRTPSL